MMNQFRDRRPMEQSANRDCVTVESRGGLRHSGTPSVVPVKGRGLTRTQAKALLFVCDHWQKTGFSPSFEDLRVAMGLASRSGSSRLLYQLVDREYLKIERCRARSIQLTPAAVEWFWSLGASKAALAA